MLCFCLIFMLIHLCDLGLRESVRDSNKLILMRIYSHKLNHLQTHSHPAGFTADPLHNQTHWSKRYWWLSDDTVRLPENTQNFLNHLLDFFNCFSLNTVTPERLRLAHGLHVQVTQKFWKGQSLFNILMWNEPGPDLMCNSTKHSLFIICEYGLENSNSTFL